MGRRNYSKACSYDVVGSQVTKRYLSFFNFVISRLFYIYENIDIIIRLSHYYGSLNLANKIE
jgi:hypothetical protein